MERPQGRPTFCSAHGVPNSGHGLRVEEVPKTDERSATRDGHGQVLFGPLDLRKGCIRAKGT